MSCSFVLLESWQTALNEWTILAVKKYGCKISFCRAGVHRKGKRKGSCSLGEHERQPDPGVTKADSQPTVRLSQWKKLGDILGLYPLVEWTWKVCWVPWPNHSVCGLSLFDQTKDLDTLVHGEEFQWHSLIVLGGEKVHSPECCRSWPCSLRRRAAAVLKRKNDTICSLHLPFLFWLCLGRYNTFDILVTRSCETSTADSDFVLDRECNLWKWLNVIFLPWASTVHKMPVKQLATLPVRIFFAEN